MLFFNFSTYFSPFSNYFISFYTRVFKIPYLYLDFYYFLIVISYVFAPLHSSTPRCSLDQSISLFIQPFPEIFITPLRHSEH